MSSDEIAIQVTGLSKRYEIYDRPSNRLKQFILPKLVKLFGKVPENYFRDFWALKDISFEVKNGETVGIIGRNGSGKSTLLQIICGTLDPTNGTVKTRGRIAALLELGTGFNHEFTGRENVYLNGSVLGLTKKQIDERFDEIVKFADIGEFIDQPLKTYSSGMVMRLAFAVIAHVDADILVIDEALAVGDAFFTQKCMLFLREFMKNGTVLFVSHDIAAIKGLCSNVLWVDNGFLIDQGSAKEICDKFLQAIYEKASGHSLSLAEDSKKRNAVKDINFLNKEMIDKSNLRNDLRVFQFNESSSSFGKGGAYIESVDIIADDKMRINQIIGGEVVNLIITCKTLTRLSSPIIGFFFRDRLGQNLFGDNSYLSHLGEDLDVAEGYIIRANFKFQMPILPIGDYSISVAIADGVPEEHTQHHWIHDALFLRSDSTSISTGLIGIPMMDINIETINLNDKE